MYLPNSYFFHFNHIKFTLESIILYTNFINEFSNIFMVILISYLLGL